MLTYELPCLKTLDFAFARQKTPPSALFLVPWRLLLILLLQVDRAGETVLLPLVLSLSHLSLSALRGP